MSDPRVDLARLSLASADDVLRALDSVEIVVSAPLERCASSGDQAALFNIVNLAARLFPWLTVQVDAAINCDFGPFGAGPLVDVLTTHAQALAPSPTATATRTYGLAWGVDAGVPGISGDGAGMSYSIGLRHIPLPDVVGPPLGALAATALMVGQAFGHVLSEFGIPHYEIEGCVSNLLDYANTPAPCSVDARAEISDLLVLGCGSVGSSLLYSAFLADLATARFTLVDPDRFQKRNVLRYPILFAFNDAPKSKWLEEMVLRAGLLADSFDGDVQSFVDSKDDPPVITLAAVSVDTLRGRRDATDVFARTTLSAGVDGMALHVSRHGFGDDRACAYCQYVDAEAELGGAQVLANLIGLRVERVIELEISDAPIAQADVDEMTSSGKWADAEPPLAGERIADIRRRAYAQATVQTAGGELLVSAPFVSAMAGLLLLTEAIKESNPELHEYRLRGRYNIDMTGEPTGFTQEIPQDQTGRCLCHSGFRRAKFEGLHGKSPQS